MGKWISAAVVFLVVVIGMVWLVQGNDFFMYKVFAPQYAKVQRQTFEQTKSFISGTINELEKYKLQYALAKDQGTKDALASVILHDASNLPDPSVMPADLYLFVQSLKNPANNSSDLK